MSGSEPVSCEGCGFVWDGVGRADAISGINDAVAGFVGVIEKAGDAATFRPEPDRWSIVEYAAHLRDVLLSLRERIVVASVVDDAVGTPIYRDQRVALGFYSLDSVEDAADELAMAAGLISKTIAALPEGYDDRTMVYSPVTNTTVTIGWIAAQAAHEAVHHLGDVEENLARLN